MIFKKHHQNNYTCVSNDLLKDYRLSNKSIGLMVRMLSLPDNWDFSIAGLAAISKDQEGSIKSSLDELKALGYVVIEPYREGGRIVDWVYNIYETPLIPYEKDSRGYPKINKEELTKVQKETLQRKLEEEKVKEDKKAKKEAEIKHINEVTDDVIEYLNTKAQTKYTNCKTNFELIKSLLKQNYTTEDMKLVIDSKCSDWLYNKDMKQYIRPLTLFGDKFDGYLSSAKVKMDSTYSATKINTTKVY